MDISGGRASVSGGGNVLFKKEISASLFEKIDLSKYALTPTEVYIVYIFSSFVSLHAPFSCFLLRETNFNKLS